MAAIEVASKRDVGVDAGAGERGQLASAAATGSRDIHSVQLKRDVQHDLELQADRVGVDGVVDVAGAEPDEMGNDDAEAGEDDIDDGPLDAGGQMVVDLFNEEADVGPRRRRQTAPANADAIVGAGASSSGCWTPPALAGRLKMFIGTCLHPCMASSHVTAIAPHDLHLRSCTTNTPPILDCIRGIHVIVVDAHLDATWRRRARVYHAVLGATLHVATTGSSQSTSGAMATAADVASLIGDALALLDADDPTRSVVNVAGVEGSPSDVPVVGIANNGQRFAHCSFMFDRVAIMGHLTALDVLFRYFVWSYVVHMVMVRGWWYCYL